MTDMPRGEIYAEPQRLTFSGESRYLNPLWVSGNEHRSNSTTIGLKLGVANMDPNDQKIVKIQDKIEAALKVVTFREQHVLVQFWWPQEVGKHKILTTTGQPFGVGRLDAGLSLYRRDSEGRSFVVDKDSEEEDHSPAARVFRQGLPEWTPDITSYMPKHFPQQECAIRCNLHGYLALPVFDSHTPLCVAVLELLTSSKYTSYAYEVQQLQNALENHRQKAVRQKSVFECLRAPHAKDFLLAIPIDGLGQHMSPVEYRTILKYRLMIPLFPVDEVTKPTPSPPQFLESPFASWQIVTSLVFETVDLRTTEAFGCPALNVLNESRKNDFDKIYGILKTVCDIHSLPLAQTWAASEHSSFVSHEKVIQNSCSSFDTRCVGKVCMSRAALPFHVQDLSMWPFLKACRERHLDGSCGFVGKALLSHGSCFCGDVTKLSEEEYPLVHNARMSGLTSCFAIFFHSVEANDDHVLEFFLPPDIKDCGDVQNLVQTLKQKIEIASGFELGDSSHIQVVGPPTKVGKSVSIDPHAIQISSITTAKNNKFEMVTADSESIMVNIANKIESSAIISNQWPSKQLYPDKFSDIITGTEKNINVVGARKNDMISYPSVSMQKTSDNITDAGEKNNRLKQGRKRKIDSLTMEAVEKHVEKPIDEAAKNLGVGRSTLKRFCREHDMPSWPLPKHSKKTVHTTYLKPSPNVYAKLAIAKALPKHSKAWTKQLQWHSNKRFRFAFVVFLMVRVKRWSCSIKSHGFSGKWWCCGRHSYLPSKSDFIYQTAHLFMLLRRWRNKNSMRNTLRSGDYPAVSESTIKPKYTMNIINPYPLVAESTLVHASPKQTVTNISDIKMVTVKATFNEDMIKFQFPTSSGLLELEHEVARRIKLKSRRPRLKYKDEENDLILLACDADLHHLLLFAANHSPIRLIIVMDD